MKYKTKLNVIYLYRAQYNVPILKTICKSFEICAGLKYSRYNLKALGLMPLER